MPVQTSTARLSARAVISPEQVLESDGTVFNAKAFELYEKVEIEAGRRDILMRIFYVTYEAVVELPAEELTPAPDDGPRQANA